MRLFALLAALLSHPVGAQDWPVLKGPYLGQEPPGMDPEVFAPGLISLAEARELNSVFSPDMTMFLFTREIDGVFKMHFSARNREGVWSEPRLAGPSKTYPGHRDVDMMFAPGGQRLYFISDRPLPGYSLDRYNIWYSDRSPEGLLPPVPLGPHINGAPHELYPMIVGDGSLYFSTQRSDSLGGFDSYRAQYVDGRFDGPVNLGPAINSEHSEGDIYVAPDESYLIHVATGRPDSLGSGDLYISFKQADGSWGDDKHMGDQINSDQIDYCPMVTSDQAYFFFTRGNDLMWVDAKIIDRFRD